MTDEEAKKILGIALAHAKNYRSPLGPTHSLAAMNEPGDDQTAEKCATAVSNLAWNILRSFGYSNEQIMEMKAELTRD